MAAVLLTVNAFGQALLRVVVNQDAGRIHRYCLAKSYSIDGLGDLRLALVKRASHVVALSCRDETDWYTLTV